MKKKHRKTRGGRKPRVSPVVMARDFLGMAIEEIRVARTEESIGTRDSNVYARNKALQSAGMGVELVYKALILGQGRTPIGSGQKGHRIEVLHGQLSGTDKDELEKRIRDVGWPTASDWCRYLDDTVKHAQRKYLMYDTQRQRQGVSFPTQGPASVAGMVRVFEKGFELADRRVRFSPLQRRPNPSQTPSRLPELPDGVTIGPLIAELNLPEGYARSGEPLGGISLDPRTGEVRVLSPDEMETERDAEPDPTGNLPDHPDS